MTNHVLDEAQKTAIDMCCDMQNRLVAVTGEAGTGKTTIIKAICERLFANDISFALCAPTGKAARRIREATGFPAVTIHKLLGFNRPEFDQDTGEAISASKPSFNKQNPLDVKLIICDEYAMVSTGLHRDLVDAVGRAVLRVFGDVRQLPPIENDRLADPTSPFTRCLSMRNTIKLENVYRQDTGNGILEAARAINRGSFPARSQECQLVLSDTMVRSLYDAVRRAPDVWGSLSHQIISPARKSDVGTVKLNGALQLIINPDMQDAIELPRHKWNKNKIHVSLGDKVVCDSNVYDMRDYSERFSEWEDDVTPVQGTYIPCPETKQMLNGEVGKITHIDQLGTIEIDFGDRVVEIPPVVQEYNPKIRQLYLADYRKNIDLAYALTTHKCQGSEYDTVAYIMAPACFYNLSRQNLYTGLTRASRQAYIYTDQRALAIAIKNSKAASMVRK